MQPRRPARRTPALKEHLMLCGRHSADVGFGLEPFASPKRLSFLHQKTRAWALALIVAGRVWLGLVDLASSSRVSSSPPGAPLGSPGSPPSSAPALVKVRVEEHGVAATSLNSNGGAVVLG